MSADLIAEYEAKLATVKKFHPGWRGEDYVAHAEAELAAVKAGGLAGLKAFWERIKNPEHAVEQPASPEPDWAVLGPRLAEWLRSASPEQIAKIQTFRSKVQNAGGFANLLIDSLPA